MLWRQVRAVVTELAISVYGKCRWFNTVAVPSARRSKPKAFTPEFETGIIDAIKPFHTRVIQVAYEWRPAERWRTDRTRIVAVVLFPPEVKRQLATLEAATARATELARQKIQRALAMPPNLEALQCTVEVIDFDLRPFWDVATTLEDGTKVWLTEVERAHDCPSWPGRR